MPRPGTSKPAPPTASASKKRSRLDEFSEVTLAEEKTRQVEVEFDKARLDANVKVKLEAIKAKREVATARLEMARSAQADKMEKLRMKHEYRMAKLGAKQPILIQQPQESGQQPQGNPHEKAHDGGTAGT